MNTHRHRVTLTTYYGFVLASAFIFDSSLCKCRCRTSFTAVCWKTQGFSNHLPRLLIQLPLFCDWSQICCGSRATIWHFCFDFPIAAGTMRLQEMTENCDCNNANGPKPDLNCLFNHTKFSSGLITTDTGRDPLSNDLVCDTVQYVLCLRKIAS